MFGGFLGITFEQLEQLLSFARSLLTFLPFFQITSDYYTLCFHRLSFWETTTSVEVSTFTGTNVPFHCF